MKWDTFCTLCEVKRIESFIKVYKFKKKRLGCEWIYTISKGKITLGFWSSKNISLVTEHHNNTRKHFEHEWSENSIFGEYELFW